jgi:hypothetical protein
MKKSAYQAPRPEAEQQPNATPVSPAERSSQDALQEMIRHSLNGDTW